ncbi:hypothetical protein ACU8KH_00947 [Lachancea thermotolerans]
MSLEQWHKEDGSLEGDVYKRICVATIQDQKLIRSVRVVSFTAIHNRMKLFGSPKSLAVVSNFLWAKLFKFCSANTTQLFLYAVTATKHGVNTTTIGYTVQVQAQTPPTGFRKTL